MESETGDISTATATDALSAVRQQHDRRHPRFALWGKLQLTPMDDEGTLLPEETIDVIGKDMSVAGIGFSHDTPLLYRRAVISHTNPEAGRLAVEVEVIWTKKTPLGIYESGCRFIRRFPGHEIRNERK